MSSIFSGEAFSSATIQKMLDENTQLIQALIDYQNQGELKKCAQYQQMLHRNLVYLATVADSNMNLPSNLQNSGGQGIQMQQQQSNMPGPMNNGMGFRPPQNMQGGMPQGNVQMQNMPGNLQNMGSNMPNMQGMGSGMPNMSNMDANMASMLKNMHMQGNMANMPNGMPNMPTNMPNMHGMQNMPNSMQSMPNNMQGNMPNMPMSMANSMPMGPSDMMASMQQSMPNSMPVSSQNDLQSSMMMQQRPGMPGMQFGGNMQPNPGGF